MRSHLQLLKTDVDNVHFKNSTWSDFQLTLDKTLLSLIMYSYVVSSTLNFVNLNWDCIILLEAGEPLYEIITTDGAHFSNSNTQFDSVLKLHTDLNQIGHRECNSYDKGTMIKNGPLMSFFSIKCVIRAIVWIVFPKPISSARIPLRLLLNSDTSHSKPLIWYSLRVPLTSIDDCSVTTSWTVCAMLEMSRKVAIWFVIQNDDTSNLDL